MSQIRSLTFEKQAVQPLGDIFDVTTSVPNGTMILNSARVDIDLGLTAGVTYANTLKSVSLEIGTIIGNEYVIDNDPTANFFKVILQLNLVNIGTNTYLTSYTTPGCSFKMSGDLHRRCIFRIRNGTTGEIINPDYYCFHFSIIS